MGAVKRVPRSTYRLQFGPRFGFDDARRLLPYLGDLGIDTIYASPVFRARPGSKHGYDIVDPNEINSDLGSASDFDLLMDTVRKQDMGWVQDIVPNHMAFHHDNSMLMDVLKLGKTSSYSEYFDIDWNHADVRLNGRLMAPFLERPYSECLEKGDFALRLGEIGFYVTYRQNAFPLDVETYGRIFGLDMEGADRCFPRGQGPEHLAQAIQRLGEAASGQPIGRDRLIKDEIETIWRLYSDEPAVREFVDERLGTLTGRALDDLLSRQRFVLAPWRDTADAINFRRFFDVNGLIAVTVDKPPVLANTHCLVTDLLRDGLFTGLRIDHIDGLRLPESYLLELRGCMGKTYTVVEKILAGGEQLRWLSVEGTTGYDFLNMVNGTLCRRVNRRAFSRIYSEFTGCETEPRDLLYEKKKLVMNANLKADLDNLARWLTDALEDTAWQEVIDRIPSTERLREALVEILAELKVYRTYLSPTNQSWHDGIPLAEAIGRAESRNPHLLDELRLLASVLMAAPRLAGPEGARTGNLDFAMTLQQYMGAIMAKGFEDTFLYVYNRLISLNEVGGDPMRFGYSPADFHAFNLARSSSHPHSMSATATHDTKRGEDVRARINVLSEIPEEWEERILRWAEANAPGKTRKNGKEIPDRNDEYFLYQTLVGSYPFDDDLEGYRYRISRYVQKAAREAKVNTRWNNPDTSYEDGYAAFAETILTPGPDNGFLDDFLPFQRRVAHYGLFNSLSQTLIKVCAPGVPDFYQGSELWDLNLVDPDNRRPIDYGERVRLLEAIMREGAEDPAGALKRCLNDIPSGRIKFFLIHKALAARKANPYLFQKGTYTELRTDGKLADHIVAFARAHEGTYAVCVAPRFLTGVVGDKEFPIGLEVWHDTTLALPPGAPRSWKDAITGQSVMGSGAIRIGDLLKNFPVSMLLEDNE